MHEPRTDWAFSEIKEVFDMPFMDLVYAAATKHRLYFDPNQMNMCSLVSIEQGQCTEDCMFCAQSVGQKFIIESEGFIDIGKLLNQAEELAEQGINRVCLSAAWRGPDSEIKFKKIITLIKQLRLRGLQPCATLGLLTKHQIKALKQAGLDCYNHNLETAPEFFGQVVTTHRFDDRLSVLKELIAADVKICSGGIIGMGESVTHRIELIKQLSNLPQHPCSVPVNVFIPPNNTIEAKQVEAQEVVRFVATIRLVMPKSKIILAAGRFFMSQAEQALCFMAGCNSIIVGPKLLTTQNATIAQDAIMLNNLNIKSGLN